MIKVELTNEIKQDFSCDINLTESAKEKLKKTFENKPDNFLRLKIDNGGCNGLKYGFAIDNIKKEDDLSIIVDGIEIVVNSAVNQYVKGATIDYIKELQASHFKITNPNAKNSCSCGSSFSI